MGKNTLLINPATNTTQFGLIPKMHHRDTHFESGQIHLREGKHIGPNSGFGAKHIWAEHHLELKGLGYESIGDVPEFVSNITTKGTSIFCEFNDMKGNHRLKVLKNREGHIAILERRTRGDNSIFIQ